MEAARGDAYWADSGPTSRPAQRIGTLPRQTMGQINKALKAILDLDRSQRGAEPVFLPFLRGV